MFGLNSAVAVAILAFTSRVIATPVLAAPASSTTSTVGPNPNQVYINSIAYGGTGCPQGTVGQLFSEDRQTYANLLCLTFVYVILTCAGQVYTHLRFLCCLHRPRIPITNSRMNC
jgi:hypothetical protein